MTASQEPTRNWLRDQANRLDETAELAGEIVPRLAEVGFFGIGVPRESGGAGGDVCDAIDAIAGVAEASLTAAFVFWGHRAFIEYLLHTPNHALAARWLPALLRGERAGASGLSNAMKFLSGIESLQIEAVADGEGWRLNGALAWITNLRPQGYVAAAAVRMPGDAPPAIIAFRGEGEGVQRSADLDLMALRASNTAAVQLRNVRIDASDVIHADARQYLPAVRPHFLGLQCGMSIGLARVSLRSARQLSADGRGPLPASVDVQQRALEETTAQLLEGIRDGRFKTNAALMFRLRIRLADIVQQAIMLELQASGGRAYLRSQDGDFARRWREAAFIPIVTPSLTQLQMELQKQTAQAA